MSQLIESIKLNDGKFANLFYHEQRMRRSLKQLFGLDDEIDLTELLERIQYPRQGLYKCRIVYDDAVKEIEFIPYVRKPVNTLKLVEGGRVSYEFKFKNRSDIDELFEKRGDCDDILIIKDDLITDTSYANIALKRGLHWYTPWSPLLPGTMRAFLLEYGIIQTESITVHDLPLFERFKLINAILGFDGPEIDIANIKS